MAALSSVHRSYLITGIAVGVVAIVLILRFGIGSGPAPVPTPTPDNRFERFFTWPTVTQKIDPIILAREQNNFNVLVEALRKEPDLFDGWMSLAATKKMMGDFTGAAEIWEYAGMIRPSTSTAFNNLGDVYANYLQDYPKAESNFRKAIRNSQGEEKNALFYLSLFDFYRYRLKDADKALATVDEGVQQNPQDLSLYLRGARYAVEIGNRAKALEYYQAAMRLAPKDLQLNEEYRRYRDSR